MVSKWRFSSNSTTVKHWEVLLFHFWAHRSEDLPQSLGEVQGTFPGELAAAITTSEAFPLGLPKLELHSTPAGGGLNTEVPLALQPASTDNVLLQFPPPPQPIQLGTSGRDHGLNQPVQKPEACCYSFPSEGPRIVLPFFKIVNVVVKSIYSVATLFCTLVCTWFDSAILQHNAKECLCLISTSAMT